MSDTNELPTNKSEDVKSQPVEEYGETLLVGEARIVYAAIIGEGTTKYVGQ